jgi:hypothetical protein
MIAKIFSDNIFYNFKSLSFQKFKLQIKISTNYFIFIIQKFIIK